MKHTPGPWTYLKMGKTLIVRAPEIEIEICAIKGSGFQAEADKNVRVSNAHLIAAAPEMLEALEFLIEHCLEEVTYQYSNGAEYEEEVIRAGKHMVLSICDLIKKARGEK